MGLSVSQGHFGGLIREHGLIRGHGLIRRHQVVLLKSTKKGRSALLKTAVQTKTTDDCAEMYEKKAVTCMTTYLVWPIVHNLWTLGMT